MTQTLTQPETDTETKVEQSVLNVVKAFVKADNAAKAAGDVRDSKYWPMADEAINLIEKRGMSPDQVRAQFYEAMIKANGFKLKKEVPSQKLTSWRLMSLRVVKLATKGSEWIEENKAKGITGIWKMLDIITGEEAAKTEEVVQKGKEAEAVAKAIKKDKPTTSRKGISRYNKKAKSGTVTVKGGAEEINLEQEHARSFDFLVHYPDQIPSLIQDLLDEGTLSKDGWSQIVEKINLHLKEKKAA